MKISKAIIQPLQPCKDRFENFTNQHSDQTFELAEFLALDTITYKDKVWVVTRLFTQEQNVKWSIACAESVLYIYENNYPNNAAPRKAIEAALTWAQNPTEEDRTTVIAATKTNAAVAAYAAANAAVAAYAAANSAADAATNAASYAAYAADAAFAAANADDAASAFRNCVITSTAAAATSTYAASYAAAAVGKHQQDLNLLLMLECL